MTKRTVVKETLYSLVSWDYIPELGKFLHLLCHTLVCKWEDAVSMGTTTHQTGIYSRVHERSRVHVHVLMRDEKEERKKRARSNKQTRQSNTTHSRQSLFLEKK